MGDFAAQIDLYRQRINQIMPDLDVVSAEVNQDGLVNDVVVVNRRWIFRFAKNEYGVKALAAEFQVLNALQGQVLLAVPEPVCSGLDYIVYRFIPGQPLTRALFLSLSAGVQTEIARQLGEFLGTMHRIDAPELPKTLAPVTSQPWRKMRLGIESKVYPLLLPHQKTWASDLLSFLDEDQNFEYGPGLIHADLASYHILYEAEHQRISGVIDFGTSGLGDPASDFGCLLQNYGRNFLEQVARFYPNLDLFLPRARFYAQAIELQWVLLGLENKEDFWFTAHLGGARDV